MRTVSETRVVADGVAWPEGLRWHEGALWFSDVFGASVWSVVPGEEKQRFAQIEGLPSGLGFLPDGTPIVADMGSGRVLSLAGGVGSVYVDLSAITPWNINDMLVDASGRAYVGEFGYDLFAGAEPQLATLATISPDGVSGAAAQGLEFPNGIALSSDGLTLLVAESTAARISAFDVGPGGVLSHQRVWGVAEGIEFVDGLALDDAGGLWIGCHHDEVFIRMLEGGEVTDRIEVPGRWAVSCALGGQDGHTLFISTAVTDGEHYDRAVGQIESVEVQHGPAHTATAGSGHLSAVGDHSAASH